MRHFMKKAFELQTGWPFAQKGLAVALPGEYLMSQGSLNPIQYEFDSSNNFVCEILAIVSGTIGAWAQSVIDASHGTIQNGDQITIITLEGDNIMAPWPKTARIVLDTTATGDAEEVLGNLGISISPSATNFSIYGGAVILSRPEIAQTTGALTWKRSTQRMAVNYGNREVASLFTQAAYNSAVRSYTKAGNREIQSDYYLNQGKRNAAGLNFLPGNAGQSQLNVKFISDEELDLSLCNIKNVTSGSNVVTNKVLNPDGSVLVTFTLNKVTTGDEVVATYDDKILTGEMTITWE